MIRQACKNNVGRSEKQCVLFVWPNTSTIFMVDVHRMHLYNTRMVSTNFVSTDYVYWRKRLLPAALAFKGKIEVVMSDEVEYVEELEELGQKDQGHDMVLALWAGKKEKYVMSDDFDDEGSLNDFIEVRCIS